MVLTDAGASFGRHIRAAVTLGLLRAAEAEGLSGDEILVSAGLTRADLENPNRALAIERHVAVGRAMTERLGAVNAGLRSGASIYGDPRGALGYSLRRSGRHELALSRFCRFIAITNDSVRLSCAAQPEGLELRAEMVSELEALGHPAEALFAAWVAIARVVTGTHWAPLRVSFRHRAHGATSEHLEFFACPVEFGAPESGLFIGRAALALPITVNAHPLDAVLSRLRAELGRNRTWNAARFEQLSSALESGGLDASERFEGSLRDAVATWLVDAGQPALDVAYLLGYQSVDVVDALTAQVSRCFSKSQASAAPSGT